MSAKPTPCRLSDGTVRWKVRFRITPGANPTSESFDTKEAAEKFARLVDKVGGAAARDARTASDTSARHVPSLATWFEHHLTQLEASRTPGTVAEYRRLAARTWLPRLGALPVDAITREAVVGWVSAQRQTETVASVLARERALAAGKVPPEPRLYSPKSIANAHGVLSAVLGSASDAGLVAKNVARAVALPSDSLGEEMVFLTREEFAAIRDALPERWRPLVVTLVGTGMRWGEATALTVGDVDLETDLLRVVRAWKQGAEGVYLGTPKTRRSRRTIKMGAAVRAVIEPLLEGRDSDELVFTSTAGRRVRAQNFRERVWMPAVERSGITKRPRVHSLRHTHASWLLGAGVPAQVVQHRLGHESLQTTSLVYGHLLPDAQVAAALATDAAMPLPQIEAGH